MLSDVRKMKLRKSVFIFIDIEAQGFEKFKARRQLLMKLKEALILRVIMTRKFTVEVTAGLLDSDINCCN